MCIRKAITNWNCKYKEIHDNIRLNMNWTGLLLLIRIFIAVMFTYTSGSISYINDYFVIIIEITLVFSVFHYSDFHHLRSNYYYDSNINMLCCVNSLLSQTVYLRSNYCFCGNLLIVLQQVYFPKHHHNKNKTAIEERPLLDNAVELRSFIK